MRLTSAATVICTSIIAAALPAVAGKPIQPDAAPVVLDDALLLGRVGRYGRVPLHVDPIEHAIVTGQWRPPGAGDVVETPVGDAQTWAEATANDEGWFRDERLGGGYAHFSVPMPDKRVMLLEAQGHSLVYVNGELHTGDPYATGYVKIPVLLRRGVNELLFACSRGRLRVELAPVCQTAVMFNTGDLTLPDLRVDEMIDTFGALPLINATADWRVGLEIETRGDGLETRRMSVPPIPPLSVRKTPFALVGASPKEAGEYKIELRLIDPDLPQGDGDVAEITLNAVERESVYRVTFVSEIDGSVQYYAVNPASPPPGDETPPALFLSVHGAGVEAVGQARAYASKSWGHLVAPTNRRPFGFDWEDWGRLDAIEVLERAAASLQTDPQRVYLTGHSMGGHGAWQLAALLPERFAAVGPSAGWISFTSYTGAGDLAVADDVREIIRRAGLASDTLAFKRNYLHHGVYILHGGADDNVPPSEARQMRDALAEFHHDFDYHEEPGAGHWWNNSDEPGAACVDWPPMFDMFARHRLPSDAEVRDVEFVTVNPEISATSRWATIWQQQTPQQLSRVKLRCDPHKRRFEGLTENVRVLRLGVAHLPQAKPLSVKLDYQELADVPWPPAGDAIWLVRAAEQWRVGTRPPPREKGPHRAGLFKQAFNHRVMFVVGTQGTAEENAWALAKARYDAESFWYRGNSGVDIVRDTEFTREGSRDRSVILYGNADTNAAWGRLLADAPVQVRQGSVQVGERKFEGDDLAAMFVYPRPDSDVASVGVVAGTGLMGMRLVDRAPIFIAGVAYPDCFVYSPKTLMGEQGGVPAAGYFDNAWRVDSGNFYIAE